MEPQHIAPCGMNCSLCISFQFREQDLNKKGFHRSYCPGCIPRGKHCTHMANRCPSMANGEFRFCFECPQYPCSSLKNLDKRYRTKYHMSMLENLDFIKIWGITRFLRAQEAQWKCSRCGALICCHNGLCLNCQQDVFQQNKKYRWNEEQK